MHFVIHIDTISVVPDFHNCDMCSMVMVAMILYYGNHDDPGSLGIVLSLVEHMSIE